ncbi:MAG: methyltransferase domain-containing protein [Propionibacteriaceae bacterium]|jgi:SAM-dependent methyltransferase|nr:methyltransferase domain-containing protein [Propionibacteriaceae bacterium]
MEILRATSEFIDLAAPVSETGDAFDFAVNGHRVWSTRLPPLRDGVVRLDWPQALQPYLRGHGTLSIAPFGGVPAAAADIDFGGGGEPVRLVDRSGRPVVVDKWGHLGRSLEHEPKGFRDRLLERLTALLETLEGLGYEVCATGGTLLGAVRSGDLLPRDDDADLAVVLPYSHPADVSLACYELEDRLVALGHTVVRHSGAHLQVTFLAADGSVDQYIDIFCAFFRNGEYCQPFHVRTPLPREAILPFGRVVLAGLSLPAPALPEAWLEACYGPNWQIPDPAFYFDTPWPTRRRYEHWFGLSQNVNREFWETAWADELADPDPDPEAGLPQETDRRLLLRLIPAGAKVVDVGCGDGQTALWLARQNRTVVGVDYALSALALARRKQSAADLGKVRFEYLNLNDSRRVLEFAARRLAESRPWHVVGLHVWESLDERGRSNLLQLISCLVGEAGCAFGSVFTDGPAAGGGPRTFTASWQEIQARAPAYDLAMSPLALVETASAAPRRRAVAFALGRHPVEQLYGKGEP